MSCLDGGLGVTFVRGKIWNQRRFELRTLDRSVGFSEPSDARLGKPAVVANRAPSVTVSCSGLPDSKDASYRDVFLEGLSLLGCQVAELHVAEHVRVVARAAHAEVRCGWTGTGTEEEVKGGEDVGLPVVVGAQEHRQGAALQFQVPDAPEVVDDDLVDAHQRLQTQGSTKIAPIATSGGLSA